MLEWFVRGLTAPSQSRLFILRVKRARESIIKRLIIKRSCGVTSRWYDAGGGGDGLGTSSESLEAAHETSRCVFAIDTRVRWVRRQRPVFAGSTSAAGRTTVGACGSCPLRERGV